MKKLWIALLIAALLAASPVSCAHAETEQDIWTLVTQEGQRLTQIAAPVAESIIRRNRGSRSCPNRESIAVSSANTDTSADTRLTALAADITGLRQRRYFTRFTAALITA